MASPRTVLLQAVEACLARIQVADGYRTDVGSDVTLEPAPALASEKPIGLLTVVWLRQERPVDSAVLRTHRLTTFRVVAKIPADMDEAQERVDALVSDIERALDGQQAEFPPRYSAPVYQFAEPLAAEPEAGYVGAAVTFTSNIPKQ
ncbi:hypothetical protein SAMN06296058_1248 [Pseudoxanthomonas indica]|uniref:Tail terminator n=1 Tax=Pseudoxanthomonas indica TaxID=428993 RepID=A0A1T5K0Y9_9GAMM|nr:hypothetical protein GCM10007235_17070 [Pseudoxanthomonas indica]SKC57158.1 hypothetical protein SAMN06296058_1248 [Pseudoxanthomonas indica]